MNNNKPLSSIDHFKSLQILDELSTNDTLTQRDLSTRLGLALGLVNSYIKNLVSKGFITVKAIPPKRYAYYLTPKGFAEKTRLTYDLLHDYTRIYKEARKNLKSLFKEMMNQGKKRVIFAGTDEVAEIAYITLQETDMQLVGIIATDEIGSNFFGKKVEPISSIRKITFDSVIVLSHAKKSEIYYKLLQEGVAKKKISLIFQQEGVAR
ncbi:MAG: winged helix-turn-helix transcriptional regulator [Nitrospirota bacterium]